MPNLRIIATASELYRISGKLNEALDNSPVNLADFTDLQKASSGRKVYSTREFGLQKILGSRKNQFLLLF